MDVKREVEEKICQASDNVGISLDGVSMDELINDYISDSITFVSFIVELENSLEISIPDEYLLNDGITFKSLIDLTEDLNAKSFE